MSILKKAKLEMAYLKAGVYGQAGSGKTYTATSIAIGLHKYIKSKKPVAFSDTETGSDFMIPRYEEAGIELQTAKSRAFEDLLGVGKEAEKICDIWQIDSITHFWKELVEAYLKKNNLNSMRLRDWIPVKKTWQDFTDLYVNSKLHIIMCGRAGDVWEDVQDEEGVYETKRTGTKMKAEIETAFEPSLLIEMIRHRISAQAGAGWVHRSFVEKDRCDIIDGEHFDEPTFESFLPHIKRLNLGGKHHAIDTDRNSQELFKNGKNGAYRLKQRDILMEKIEAEIYLLVPGSNTSPKVREERLELMQSVFGTKSKIEIATKQNEMLEVCLKALIQKKKIKETEEKKELKSNKKEVKK